MTYSLRPIYQRPAFAFIDVHHRHHPSPRGWLFGTSAVDAAGEAWGVVCVGRTTAREAHDPYTAEVTRVCVRTDAAPVVDRRGKVHTNCLCSMLYAAAWKACRAIGYRTLITYLLKSEPATTLKALREMGWKFVRNVDGRSWDRPGRRRVDKHPTEDKQLWAVTVDAGLADAMAAVEGEVGNV